MAPHDTRRRAVSADGTEPRDLGSSAANVDAPEPRNRTLERCSPSEMPLEPADAARRATATGEPALMMGLAVVDGDLLAGRDRPQRIELDPALADRQARIRLAGVVGVAHRIGRA